MMTNTRDDHGDDGVSSRVVVVVVVVRGRLQATTLEDRPERFFRQPRLAHCASAAVFHDKREERAFRVLARDVYRRRRDDENGTPILPRATLQTN